MMLTIEVTKWLPIKLLSAAFFLRFELDVYNLKQKEVTQGCQNELKPDLKIFGANTSVGF